MEGKSSSKEEQKSEANAGEILKKCGRGCDGGVPMPPSRIIQLMMKFVICASKRLNVYYSIYLVANMSLIIINHFSFISPGLFIVTPEPKYKGPENITYFRGQALEVKNLI